MISNKYYVIDYNTSTINTNYQINRGNARLTEMGEIYLCEICGTEIEILFPGNDPIICCGLDMIAKEEYYKERMSR
jgi:desulfoferrodoxin-like iron-binding protein